MKIPGHLLIESVQLAPGQEWGDEAHAWRFVQVSRGSAYWLDPARPRAINIGEVLVVAPKTKALVRASQLNEVLLYGFHFNPQLLCGFFTMVERQFFDQSCGKSADAVQFLPSTHPLAKSFAHLVARGELEPDLALRVEVLGLAVGFFTDQISRHEALPANPISAQYRFQQIISEMPELELINYTPEQLAALCGCSPRHFNRLFHVQFGESPRARQTELRLLKAQQLLGDTTIRIAQVALESGYRSVTLFNGLFKRRFGMSPSEWRQQGSSESAHTTTLPSAADHE